MEIKTIYNSTGNFFDAQRAFGLIYTQTGFGPRYPGSAGHPLVVEFIRSELGRYAGDIYIQPFEITLFERKTLCENILGVIKGLEPGRKILLGTHYDTRPIADREWKTALKNKPIPGANDGGSGTAVMLELARILSVSPPPRDVIFAFFDAEDVGHLDNNTFYNGSLFFSKHMGAYTPDEVIILDMVGGRNLNLDVELNSLIYDPVYSLKTRAMLIKLLQIAHRYSYHQFYADKREKYKYIECDHIPFLHQLIPAYILIDIDYPQWHTQRDLPEFCSPESLKAVGDVVLEYIYDPLLPEVKPLPAEKRPVERPSQKRVPGSWNSRLWKIGEAPEVRNSGFGFRDSEE